MFPNGLEITPRAIRPSESSPGEKEYEVSLADAFRVALKHWEQHNPAQAGKICRKILKSQPNHARALHLLGLVIYKDGQNEEAAELIERAIKLRPDLKEFYNSLGMVQMVLGRYEEALGHYRKVLDMVDPEDTNDRPKLLSNIANALQLLGQYDEAITWHDKALELRPDDVVATWNRSHIFLIKGDLLAGWDGYERRFELKKAREKFYPHEFDVPKWDGSSFKGKRLFIHDEQGIGDIIQFARYMPLVKEKGGQVIFEVRGVLFDLFKSLKGVDHLVERIPNTRTPLCFDLYSPIMSLQAVLKTTLETIPNEVPYLSAPQDKIDQWKDRFEGDGLKVGLVWAGNLNNIPLRHRASKLAFMEPLLHIPGISFFGLQKGEETAVEVDELPKGLRFPSYGEEFQDFADTAGALSHLDLVITVDTSVAHLAGAMGIPTWIMLAYPADWRWLLDRSDNPWYPTARLFRMPEPGDWVSVVAEIETALREKVGAKKKARKKSSKAAPKKASPKEKQARKTIPGSKAGSTVG
ncbi:MAG: tetratricopeptide repeat-containing glycosyltransferase family protein [Gammaproteobacteria bacterium]